MSSLCAVYKSIVLQKHFIDKRIILKMRIFFQFIIILLLCRSLGQLPLFLTNILALYSFPIKDLV